MLQSQELPQEDTFISSQALLGCGQDNRKVIVLVPMAWVLNYSPLPTLTHTFFSNQTACPWADKLSSLALASPVPMA